MQKKTHPPPPEKKKKKKKLRCCRFVFCGFPFFLVFFAGLFVLPLGYEALKIQHRSDAIRLALLVRLAKDGVRRRFVFFLFFFLQGFFSFLLFCFFPIFLASDTQVPDALDTLVCAADVKMLLETGLVTRDAKQEYGWLASGQWGDLPALVKLGGSSTRSLNEEAMSRNMSLVHGRTRIESSTCSSAFREPFTG